MKLFAPEYYRNFTCIADKCTHSCCVGWEIDIDECTLEKYESLSPAYGKAIRNSIDYKEMAHFRLGENERCPHLDKNGLCHIIKELGESYLCEICAEHPRFYNNTLKGKEVGLGMCCEEACRIILDSDSYDVMVNIGTLDWDEEINGFDATQKRAEIYSVLKNHSISYKDRLRKIYEESGISPSMLSDAEWKKVISQLEYLNEEHKSLFLNYSSELDCFGETEAYLERALAYFIYRHLTEARNKDELCTRLGFCLFCERLLFSIFKSTKGDIKDLARIISEEIEYSTDNTEKIMEQFEAFI